MTHYRSTAWYRIVLHVIVPAGLTILLFVGAIYGLVLPQFERNFMNQKRQMIRELTGSVYALVEHHHARQIAGELTVEQAQQRALESIRAIRYGPENKDYFWINDLHPVMVMHPYRTDLEGQDISDYADPQGKRLFVEFVKTVQANPDHTGYVDYMWQWKDDESVIVPKLSHVRLFEPWDWVIGTGVYLEDVRTELAAITRRMEASVIVIVLIITVISGYLIWQGVCTEVGRQSAEQQRESLMQSLEIKNEELQSVVYVASHDLRSPLINLQGFSNELEHTCIALADLYDQPDTEDKQAKISTLIRDNIPESLSFIKTNTEKMKRLVEGLLQLSRLGAAELHVETLDMNELMQNVVASCQYQIKELNAAVETTDLPACQADAKLIDQVFTNLIDNALKYHHHQRTPQINITGQRVDRTVLYQVADNGIGMESEQQEKVFEMFHQANTNGRSDGVGLGLTIVKRIIQIMGGNIRVESQPDKGTTFTLILKAKG